MAILEVKFSFVYINSLVIIKVKCLPYNLNLSSASYKNVFSIKKLGPDSVVTILRLKSVP